ncbi:MAG: sulfatase [Pseudomonadota bacterium]|nr:sulfatase [Pseudomonadota bacterium]
MLVLVAVAALAASPNVASPLVVTTTPVPLASLVVDADANGIPDGWTRETTVGSLTVAKVAGPGGDVARIAYAAGTKGHFCSARTPVSPGATVTLSSAVRGEASLGDVTALHLHLDGPNGVLHTARRRIDVGDVGWDPVDMRATAPAGTVGARVCLEVQMIKADQPGALLLAPLVMSELRATSRSSSLPLKRVLLVSIETFRRDHVSAYGYPRLTTPTFDSLVAGGTSYDNHWTPAPYTHPSLASLVTGLLPTRLGFVDNIPSIGGELLTAAQLFARGGYVTAAFNVQYVLSNRYGLNRGFHYYRNHPNDVPAAKLTEEVLPFLEEHGDDNLFLWMHYFDPHGPYRPPADQRKRFVGDATWDADTVTFKPGTAQEGSPDIPPYVLDKGQTERRHYVAGYDGDISYLDEELGKLVRYVKTKGWAEDTLIVVTADHGESLGDHGRTFCHGSLYETDLDVPMVIWAPGRVAAGAHVMAETNHVDVLPTLLAYAGLPIPPGLHGVSLQGVTTQRPAGSLPVNLAVVGRAERMRWAVREGDTKVILDRDGRLESAWKLDSDPGELRDLGGMPTKEARALVKAAQAWLGAGTWKPPIVREQALDEEDLARLRALGYVE